MKTQTIKRGGQWRVSMIGNPKVYIDCQRYALEDVTAYLEQYGDDRIEQLKIEWRRKDCKGILPMAGEIEYHNRLFNEWCAKKGIVL